MKTEGDKSVKTTETVNLNKVLMCCVSARTLKVDLKPTTANNVDTPVYMDKATNYTLTLSNVPTPVKSSG